MASPGMWQSDERLYVNRARTRVVPGDSPEAAFVLVGANGEIPLAEAERLGLAGGGSKDKSSSPPAPEPAGDFSPPAASAPEDEVTPASAPEPTPTSPEPAKAQPKAEDKAVKSGDVSNKAQTTESTKRDAK